MTSLEQPRQVPDVPEQPPLPEPEPDIPDEPGDPIRSVGLQSMFVGARACADSVLARCGARWWRWCLSVHQYVNSKHPCDRRAPSCENVGRIVHTQVNAR